MPTKKRPTKKLISKTTEKAFLNPEEFETFSPPAIAPSPYIPERTMTRITSDQNTYDKKERKWNSYLISFVVFLFPFIVLPWTFSPHEFSKQIFLTALVGIGIIAILTRVFKTGQFNLIPRHLAIPLGILTAIIMLVSAIRSDFTAQGLMGFSGTESFSLLTFTLMAIWVLLISSYKKHSSLQYIVMAIIVSGNVLALITLLSILGVNIYAFIPSSGFNPTGTTTVAGIISGISLIIAIGIWYNAINKKTAIMSLVAMIFPALLLLSAGLRAPLIIVAVGLACLLILRALSRERHTQGLKSGILLGIIILAIILAIYPFTSILKTKIPMEIAPTHSETLSITRQVLSEHLLLGSGPGSFNYGYLKYRSLPILQTPFWNIGFDWGSSAGLTIFATVGIIGGAFFCLSILAILCWYGFRLISEKINSDDASFPHQSLFAAGLGLFAAFWLAPAPIALQFLFATILGIMLSLSSTTLKIERPDGQSSLGISLIGSITIILIMGIFVLQGRRVAAEIFATRSLNAPAQDIAKQAELINRAVKLDSYNDGYLRLATNAQRQLLKQQLSTDPTSQNQQLFIQQIRNLADILISSAKRAIAYSSGNVANWVNLGQAYLDIAPITNGAGQAVIDAFTQAQKLSPTDPSILVNLSMARSNLDQAGAEEKNIAVESLRKAIAIRPSFTIAHIELARLLGTQGNFDEALAEYRIAETIVPNDASIHYEIGLFLIQNEKYAEAQAEFESAIAITPNFSNARWFLAQAYEKQENLDKAVAQIKKVIELNPDNQQAKDRLAELDKKLK